MALWILAGLVLAHLLAVGAYYAQARQQALLVRFLEARDLWKDGHLAEAAETYRAFLRDRETVAWPVLLIRHYPSAADAWYLLGRVEADRGLTDPALAAYAQSMADGGRGARETRELLLTEGRLAALRDWATTRMATEPLSPQPFKDRAAAYLELGQPQDAARDYATALARLPAWRSRVDPAAPLGLSGEEADLLNLAAAAALAAQQRDSAIEYCDQISTRQGKNAHLDRLCLALIAAHDGQNAKARLLLRGYLPPAAEHEWLTRGLLETP